VRFLEACPAASGQIFVLLIKRPCLSCVPPCAGEFGLLFSAQACLCLKTTNSSARCSACHTPASKDKPPWPGCSLENSGPWALVLYVTGWSRVPWGFPATFLSRLSLLPRLLFNIKFILSWGVAQVMLGLSSNCETPSSTLSTVKTKNQQT
jgi:hypothetical protein